MAYDEKLAQRVRAEFESYSALEEKKMFGGLCFMLEGHMCCGIVGGTLMARVGPQQYSQCLSKPHVREMDFTGKPMKGMIYVDSGGLNKKSQLSHWVRLCREFVQTLPPKNKAKIATAKRRIKKTRA